MRTIEELKQNYSADLWDLRSANGIWRGLTVLPECGTCQVYFGTKKYRSKTETVFVSHVEADLIHSDRTPTDRDVEELKRIFFGKDEVQVVKMEREIHLIEA